MSTAQSISVVPASTRGRVSLAGQLRSEMIRFFALKSTRILLLVSVVVYVGIAAMAIWGVGSLLSGDEQMAQASGLDEMGGPAFTAEMLASGLVFSQLILGVLGVLLISGEFTTGSAVSTFLASPQRLRVLTAKVILITLLTGVVQILSTLIAYLVCRPLADNYNMVLDFGSSAFQRMLWFGALAVVMAALIGLALGVLMRNSAGAITSLVALFFVLPLVVSMLSMLQDWIQNIGQFLPDRLGTGLALPLTAGSELEIWQQLLSVALWILIPLILGGVLLKVRDIK